LLFLAGQAFGTAPPAEPRRPALDRRPKAPSLGNLFRWLTIPVR